MIGREIGHYRITAKLGAGGMGEVFLAEDTRLERKAAIKFLPLEMATDPERRQRFLKEARAASALNHPSVCVVYDVGETDDGRPFIAMEYIEGGTLDAVVEKGPLDRSFEIVYDSEGPIAPIPYPDTRSHGEWDSFLNTLRLRWDGHWANPVN